MWICTNKGFISIVQDEKDPAILKVRARNKAHLEALFPNVEITETEWNDYRYRVFVDRVTVAKLLDDIVLADTGHPAEITYGNFKDSVKDRELHDLYAGFWSDHYAYQKKNVSRTKLAVPAKAPARRKTA